MMARAQGVEGIGPVTAADALQAALADAVARLRQGKGVVVDVHVTPGYSPSMAAGITRSQANLELAKGVTRRSWISSFPRSGNPVSLTDATGSRLRDDGVLRNLHHFGNPSKLGSH